MTSKRRPAPLNRLAPLMLALACFGVPPAQAQPMGADGSDFLYRVGKGDILLEISRRFTDSAGNWPVLQHINQVADTYKLPIGKVLRIPFSMIPEVDAPARLVHVRGAVRVNGRLAQAGDDLPQGGTLVTPPGGFATLQLSDGSTLTLPANSTIVLERLQAFKGTGLTDTIVSIEDGSLESVVSPEDTGVGRFEVRTPVAITGVRGTRLRVHKDDEVARTEVLEGVAHTRASSTGQAMLRSGHGVTARSDGVLGAVRPLPAAPALSVPVRGPQGWQAEFPAVPGAVAYLVRVAGDPLGTRLLSSERRDSAGQVTFSAGRPGTHYVLVRAIDRDGLMGPDAVQPFEGRVSLLSSDGNPVGTGYGDTVTLNEY